MKDCQCSGLSVEYCYFSVWCLQPELWVKYSRIKGFKGLKTLKNIRFSLINWVIGIAQKSNSTLDNGNLSLENIQSWNPTLKTIKMRLKLVRWWQKSNFQSIFLYFQIVHVFLSSGTELLWGGLSVCLSTKKFNRRAHFLMPLSN